MVENRIGGCNHTTLIFQGMFRGVVNGDLNSVCSNMYIFPICFYL